MKYVLSKNINIDTIMSVKIDNSSLFIIVIPASKNGFGKNPFNTLPAKF